VKDKTLFIKAIQEHSGIILKAASLYTSNIQDREDLTQEIVFQLWKSFDTFQHKSSITTWIYRVAMNVSVYFLKQTKKKIQTMPISEEALKVHSFTDEENEAWGKIHQQIKDLNILEKGIIMLYLEGKDYKSIAEIVGLSETNIASKISRIKAKLRKRINKKIRL